MTLRDLLLGRWLGHPLHPATVHIPTALWPAALIFDVLSRLTDFGNPLVKTSFYAILVGLIAALLAIPTGVAEWSQIHRERPAWRIAVAHLALNLLATVLWAVNLGLRWSSLDTARRIEAGPLILSAIATAVLFVAGYLGGVMVFQYGIGVARSAGKHWRRQAEAGGANVPAE